MGDMASAMNNLRSRSYEGFVILLKMINYTDNSSTEAGATFLVPIDKVLSEYTLSPLNIQQFVLRHRIEKPLPFKNLMSFPTGTQIPSGLPNQTFTITNGGWRNFNVNNAKIIAPNICKSSLIKCHGIDAVISLHQQTIPPPPPALMPPPANIPHPDLGKNIPSTIHRQKPQISLTEATPGTLEDQNSSSGGVRPLLWEVLVIWLFSYLVSLLLFTLNI
ncbi:FAS1 domain-containing protein SELMODRAFT_448915-like [Aristolochia californica]|uniref:FAS1 domain-containing protein SELMODRAFT_448915-like n=1 Tax=Aristolochia californica TaxID=171875 RepID=UPI0035DCFD4C